MQEFFGAIGIGPGLAVMLFGMAAALKFGWDWRDKVQKAGAASRPSVGVVPVPLPAGDVAPTWQFHMTAALTDLAGAVRALGEKMERLVERQEITVTAVGEIAVQSEQLATKAELIAAAKENRHATAGGLQLIMAKLQAIHDDLRFPGRWERTPNA